MTSEYGKHILHELSGNCQGKGTIRTARLSVPNSCPYRRRSDAISNEFPGLSRRHRRTAQDASGKRSIQGLLGNPPLPAVGSRDGHAPSRARCSRENTWPQSADLEYPVVREDAAR